MSETKTAVQAAEEFLKQWDTPANVGRYGPMSYVNVAYILETARRQDNIEKRVKQLAIRPTWEACKEAVATSIEEMRIRCNTLAEQHKKLADKTAELERILRENFQSAKGGDAN